MMAHSGPLFFGDEYQVSSIESKDTHWWLKNIHYAGRIPSISYAFGLFHYQQLVGVVTYGKPASPPLCKGICGPDYAHLVIELNRLVLLENRKNEASRLVGASLKLLPRPSIVVSFADTSQDHTGFVYQATNFIYTGLSFVRTDWSVRGKEHLHGKTISDKAVSMVENERPADYMRRIYGDDFYLRQRPRKHRYVFFCGSKRERKEMMGALRYEVLPYPKPTHREQ